MTDVLRTVAEALCLHYVDVEFETLTLKMILTFTPDVPIEPTT